MYTNTGKNIHGVYQYVQQYQYWEWDFFYVDFINVYNR